jgi:hypothetical protein
MLILLGEEGCGFRAPTTCRIRKDCDNSFVARMEAIPWILGADSLEKAICFALAPLF